MTLNLFPLFEHLQLPDVSIPEGYRFCACSIPNFERHRLAKDSVGSPALLIDTQSTEYFQVAPIHLEHLHVSHNVECSISDEYGHQAKGVFSVVHCIGGDLALHHYFLSVLHSIVVLLGSEPSQRDITRAINKFVNLFRAMAEPARKSTQGFWAELFLIAQAVDPVTLLRAWHATPYDIYDFNAGKQRIEVKSTCSQVRQHRFSLEQLRPPEGTRVLVASLFVERAGGGVSLSNLLTDIRERIEGSTEHLIHLDQVVASTLGDNWRQGLTTRFDRELAQESLQFYDAAVIPRIDTELPPGISDVRFTSNLTGIDSVSRKQMKTSGDLFQAALSN